MYTLQEADAPHVMMNTKVIVLLSRACLLTPTIPRHGDGVEWFVIAVLLIHLPQIVLVVRVWELKLAYVAVKLEYRWVLETREEVNIHVLFPIFYPLIVNRPLHQLLQETLYAV